MENEPQIRLAFFLGTFLLMSLWELISVQSQLKHSKSLRWFNNIVLVALNTLIVRFALFYSATQVSEYAQFEGIGLINWLVPNYYVAIIGSIIFLDFAIYFQHLIFHKVPLFWKIHRMHHADLDYDVTTALRFHPIEIVLSMLIKFGLILALGIPPIAIIIFEIILNAMAMFNHANIKLPLMVDKILRILFVTPDMHRIHHSVVKKETNSNYGFNLSIWDRIFKTYNQTAEKNTTEIDIGIESFREQKYLKIHQMLTIPFIK